MLLTPLPAQPFGLLSVSVLEIALSLVKVLFPEGKMSGKQASSCSCFTDRKPGLREEIDFTSLKQCYFFL